MLSKAGIGFERIGLGLGLEISLIASVSAILTLPMLRLLSSEAQEHKAI